MRYKATKITNFKSNKNHKLNENVLNKILNYFFINKKQIEFKKRIRD